LATWLFDALTTAPDADAIVTGRGRWTRRQLRDAAARLAGELSGRRPVPDLVVVATSRPELTAIATIGGLLAGVPVRHDDPQRPEPGGAVVVADRPLPGSARLALPGLDVHVAALRSSDRVTGLPPGAQIFATSGSTGAPVGVVRSAAAVRNDCGRIATALHAGRPRPVVLASPAFHAYGFSHLVSSLLAGAVLRYCPPLSSPSALSSAAAAIRAGVLVGLPFQYRLLVAAPEARLPDDLSVAVSSTAPLAPDVARRAVETLRLPLVDAYGSSETGTISFGAVSARAPLEVGAPLPGIRVRVTAEHALWLSTDGLATGYLDDSGLRPLPVSDGWYHTGDLAELVDGRIRLLGRTRDLLNIAGKKVSRTRIEQTLAGHPQVTEAQVVTVTDPLRGELPIARVVVVGDLTVDQLVRWSRTRLAPYEMPRRFEIRAGLTRSATGKLLHDG
jgi:acyl-coenzyme A synthetase/AMP-(fatty) acid ligase